MINELKSEEARIIDPMHLNTLTLERNSVLVARVKRSDFYDCETLQALYDSLCKKFPCHTVFVWYDDVEFMAIEDKAYMSKEVPINDTPNYY